MALLEEDRGLELCLDCKHPSKRKKSEEKLKPKVSCVLIEALREQLLRLLAANVKICPKDTPGVVGTGPAQCPGHAGCPSPGHLNKYTKYHKRSIILCNIPTLHGKKESRLHPGYSFIISPHIEFFFL